MAHDLEIAEARRGEVAVLTVVGSLNTTTSARFEGKMLELLKAKQRLFVVDFAGVDYVSSAALRVLLMVAKRLGTGGGQVGLSGLNPEVRKVFQISGFDRDFLIVRTADEAVDQLARMPRPPAAAPPPRPVAANAAPATPAPPPPDPLAALGGRLAQVLDARPGVATAVDPAILAALAARLQRLLATAR